MSSRRLLASSTLALLVPASLLVPARPGPRSTPSRRRRRASPCSSGPAADQAGGSPPDRPARGSGRQSRRGEGSHSRHHSAGASRPQGPAPGAAWRNLGGGWPHPAGQAGPGPVRLGRLRERGALTYRVKAMASHGLRALKSNTVSTARWLDPTWTDEFSGSHLDTIWSHRGRDYVGSNRRSCSKGDPSAVSVGGGAVRLSVITDPAPRPGAGSADVTRPPEGSPTASTATSARRGPSPSGTASPRRG